MAVTSGCLSGMRAPSGTYCLRVAAPFCHDFCSCRHTRFAGSPDAGRHSSLSLADTMHTSRRLTSITQEHPGIKAIRATILARPKFALPRPWQSDIKSTAMSLASQTAMVARPRLRGGELRNESLIVNECRSPRHYIVARCILAPQQHPGLTDREYPCVPYRVPAVAKGSRE